MPKVEEAQAVLQELGMPVAQQSDLAAYALLALAGLREDTPWDMAQRRLLRIHDINIFTSTHYTRNYAENSRESFRKSALKQFVQAAIAEKNADDPSRSTTSGKTCYSLSEEALSVIRARGKPEFKARVKAFLAKQGSLREKYAALRKRHVIPVSLPSDLKLELSPGRHNQLQAAIVNFFWPNFIREGKLLYLGDTSNKSLYVIEAELHQVGFPFTKDGKFPDVVFLLEEKGWLVIVEAVTSHGPVSPERKIEFEEMLAGCSLHPVFVTAFLTWQEFKKEIARIAWDTEVWLAEVPEHMIHFNGPKFLAPAPEEELEA